MSDTSQIQELRAAMIDDLEAKIAELKAENAELQTARREAYESYGRLEQSRLDLKAENAALEKQLDEYQRLSRRLITDTTSRWALDQLILLSLENSNE
jgi:cell shape-determining protein MreC